MVRVRLCVCAVGGWVIGCCVGAWVRGCMGVLVRGCVSALVRTIRRLLKIIGLLCKRALSKRLHSAKETCNFKEPTNRSHPVYVYLSVYIHEYVCLSHHI